MRILSLIVVGLAACASNPDTRELSFETIEHTAYGGLVEVTMTGGGYDLGELIAVQRDAIVVDDTDHIVRTFPKAQIAKARLWKWHRDGAIGTWGTVGSISTLTQGIFSGLTLPIWIATTATVIGIENRATHIDVPGASWDELAAWARFPQGIPDGVDPASFMLRDGPPGAM